MIILSLLLLSLLLLLLCSYNYLHYLLALSARAQTEPPQLVCGLLQTGRRRGEMHPQHPPLHPCAALPPIHGIPERAVVGAGPVPGRCIAPGRGGRRVSQNHEHHERQTDPFEANAASAEESEGVVRRQRVARGARPLHALQARAQNHLSQGGLLLRLQETLRRFHLLSFQRLLVVVLAARQHSFRVAHWVDGTRGRGVEGFYGGIHAMSIYRSLKRALAAHSLVLEDRPAEDDFPFVFFVKCTLPDAPDPAGYLLAAATQVRTPTPPTDPSRRAAFTRSPAAHADCLGYQDEVHGAAGEGDCR
jgi:hypothetical protein